jgi:hypothetical protein
MHLWLMPFVPQPQMRSGERSLLLTLLLQEKKQSNLARGTRLKKYMRTYERGRKLSPPLSQGQKFGARNLCRASAF